MSIAKVAPVFRATASRIKPRKIQLIAAKKTEPASSPGPFDFLAFAQHLIAKLSFSKKGEGIFVVDRLEETAEIGKVFVLVKSDGVNFEKVIPFSIEDSTISVKFSLRFSRWAGSDLPIKVDLYCMISEKLKGPDLVIARLVRNFLQEVFKSNFPKRVEALFGADDSRIAANRQGKIECDETVAADFHGFILGLVRQLDELLIPGSTNLNLVEKAVYGALEQRQFWRSSVEAMATRDL